MLRLKHIIIVVMVTTTLIVALDINLWMLGPTGAGKSATANNIGRAIGNRADFNEFGEDGGAASYTRAPQTVRFEWAGKFIAVTDTPGLLDAAGVAQDEKNIRQIVDYARNQNEVHGFILVINEQNPRLEGPVQDAIKVLVDSFGSQIMNNFGIVFTRSTTRTKEESVQWVDREAKRMLEMKLGFSIRHIPSWQGDNHPEDLAVLKVPQEQIEKNKAQSKTALLEMTRWVTTLHGIPTADAKYGEYESQQRIRLEQQRAAEEAEKARQAEIAAENANRRADEERGRAEKAEQDLKNAQQHLHHRKKKSRWRRFVEEALEVIHFANHRL